MSNNKSSEFNKNIELVWNGINKELYHFKKNTLGKVLTIIDAVIVDKNQNKSVKNLISQAVWENENTEFNMAKWLLWFKDNQDEDNGSSVPMYYREPPAPSLINYTHK